MEIFSHYIRLQECSIFHAPQVTVKPYEIQKNSELIEIITGGVVYFPDDTNHQWHKGTVFCHQSGEKTIWKTDVNNPYRCIFMRFVTDGTPRKFPRISVWKNIPELKIFTEDMLDFAQRDMLGDDRVFSYALGVLSRQMINDAPLPRALQKACGILNRDPTHEISIEELSEKVNLSSSRLFALFQKYLHTSPHRYQIKSRIEMAKSMLTSRHEIPIKEISSICGFGYVEVFYRHFKQHTGLTPAEYRASTKLSS